LWEGRPWRYGWWSRDVAAHLKEHGGVCRFVVSTAFLAYEAVGAEVVRATYFAVNARPFCGDLFGADIAGEDTGHDGLMSLSADDATAATK